MTFFVDNNIGEFLVYGLRGFGVHIHHLKEIFPENTSDEVWLEFIGNEGWFLLTRDLRLNRKPIEREALKKYKVGAFYLRGKHLSRWDIIRQVVRLWHKIEELAGTTNPPFIYKIPPHGTKIDYYHVD